MILTLIISVISAALRDSSTHPSIVLLCQPITLWSSSSLILRESIAIEMEIRVFFGPLDDTDCTVRVIKISLPNSPSFLCPPSRSHELSRSVLLMVVAWGYF